MNHTKIAGSTRFALSAALMASHVVDLQAAHTKVHRTNAEPGAEGSPNAANTVTSGFAQHAGAPLNYQVDAKKAANTTTISAAITTDSGAGICQRQ